MKNKFYLLCATIFILGVTSFVMAQVNLFPLAVGATWLYDATDGDKKWEMSVEISGKENVDGVSCFVLEAHGQNNKARGQTFISVQDKGIYVKKFTGGNAMLGKMDQALNPPIPLMEFPLKTGKKWSWTGTFKFMLKEFSFTTQSEVLAKEKIKVPAGNFEAFKVRTKRLLNNKLMGEETRWYAPGTGLVMSKNSSKKIFGFGKDRTVTQALKSYNKGK